MLHFRDIETTYILKKAQKVKRAASLVKKAKNLYHIQTDKRVIVAEVVVFVAGAYSLLFTKSLDYGKDYALLNVAGNFYLAPGVLNGKVYTVQLKKIPFAAIHGDAEVHAQSQTRFGPTAKVTPLIEQYKYAIIIEYLKTAGLGTGLLICDEQIPSCGQELRASLWKEMHLTCLD